MTAFNELPIVGDVEQPGFLFFLGAYGDTQVIIFADSIDSAIEECFEWVDDNAPGLLCTPDYKEAAEELGIDYEQARQDAGDDMNRIVEKAETDLLMCGHTTLKNGSAMYSWEVNFRDLTDEEAEQARERMTGKRGNMILKEPCIITSRLLPGVEVGKSFVSIEYSDRGGDDGRTRYRYHLDFPDGASHTDDDLQSGYGGGGLQDGLCSLLSFLSAAGESYAYGMRHGCKGENADIFPEHVTEWAYQHGDELSMLSCELEEQEDLIEE